MGNITKDMERLCDEIEVSRASRASMKTAIANNNKAIKSEVSNMRSGFAKNHEAMAASSKKSREKFFSELRDDVTGLLKTFDSSLDAMATESRKDRQGFIAHLKKDVKTVRTDTAKDLAGARKAWAKMSGAGKTKKKNS